MKTISLYSMIYEKWIHTLEASLFLGSAEGHADRYLDFKGPIFGQRSQTLANAVNASAAPIAKAGV